MKPSGKLKGGRRLSRAERHEQIVEAALRTFSRCGYRGATTRQLARAAGIAEVSLFRHFPSKERLFQAVLDKYSILPVLRAEVERPPQRGRAHETLRALGLRFLQILKEREHLIRLMLSESAVNPRQARMLFRHGPARFFQDLGRLVRQFQDRGEVRRVDLAIAPRAFLGAFFMFFLAQEVFMGKETEPLSFDRAAEAITDILWNGLRADPPKRKGARRP